MSFISDFHPLVADAFPPPGLERLARFALGRRLDLLVDPTGSTPDVAFRLLEYVERHGWTEEFVRGAYEAARDTQPEHAALRAFCKTHAGYVLTARPTTGELARTVGSGLNVVLVGLSGPTGAVPVMLTKRAKRDLTELAAQFARLRHYKLLHDCLHTLQFKHARPLEQGLKALFDPNADPAGQTDAAADVAIYCAEMGDELARVRPSADALGSDAEKKWLGDAGRAVEKLKDGAERRDATTAMVGRRLLDSLLRTQPTRVNQALVGVLEQLRFDALLEAFSGIGRQLNGSGAAAAIGRATTAFGSLVPRLNRDLGDHQDWQVIDNALTQIDTEIRDNSPADVSEILWAGAAEIFDPLLAAAREAAWAIELRKLADAFAAALKGGTAPPAFRRLRARAAGRFYEVDLGLKELSTDLTMVGTHLDLLLRVIGDATD